MTLTVLAYAKLNLFLAIRGRLPDGFHEIDSIVQTIDLADRLTIGVAPGDSIEIDNSLMDLQGPDLAGVAAATLLAAKGCARAVSIRIEKRIPAAAGLGGASSDAAAVLSTLDRLIPPRLPAGKVAAIASRLGSDVALFLVGGRSRLAGRGELVGRLPQAGEHYVVMIPPARCGTADVYAAWDALRAPQAQVGETLGRNDLLAAALAVRPELAAIRDAAASWSEQHGALYSGMTGSGSAFYGAFATSNQARAAAEALRLALQSCDVHVARPTSVGSRDLGEEGALKIAIDGPAASGKTSVGRALARTFGCRFVETGNMYRAAALGALRGLSLDEMTFDLTSNERLLLNGEDVTDLLHTPELDQASSQVAVRPDVRAKLVAFQRDLAARTGVVMEGRDIGTVVLPDADVKIYLRASSSVRAERRVRERGDCDPDETLRELRTRDERDSTRAVAPLNAAPDATIIDTDQKTLLQVILAAEDLVKEHLNKRWHGV